MAKRRKARKTVQRAKKSGPSPKVLTRITSGRYKAGCYVKHVRHGKSPKKEPQGYCSKKLVD